MKPAAFKYHDPSNVEEALQILAEKENSKILAGGQSLGPMLNFRYVMPDHLIDLNTVSTLDFIHFDDSILSIGAMTRQRTLERNAELKKLCPIFSEALQWVGHYATRNRGTIGGSLSHLDPSAELPALCASYDAKLVVRSVRGDRIIDFRDWGISFMTPNLEQDELLTEIKISPWHESHGYAFVEFSRRHGDFAIAGVGCLIALDSNQNIKRLAISIIGVASTPVRLFEAEKTVIGNRLHEDLLAHLDQEISLLEASNDAQTTGIYRKKIASVLLRRAINQATQRAQQGLTQ